ncbi:RluA family pseudouridine synthase [Pullulanibacillus sp. KACC 23026]|uniref:RluA family pseudouridine synthase n=1 Tax=Pullulanibacillus sp. KACC 23026 TaxID=3028315 RepID=UPI0023AFFCA1|nr:RluA family pseudouridine synthase [Pullulanibacillus sp. KACC 23026]WEG11644.1 RluA family pseudouridine synthase [Pullulanibacillus sp. KACC 23026]
MDEETLDNQLIITETENGERLDKVLSESLEDLSRTMIQKLIKEGHVRVNEGQVKPNYKVQMEDRVEWQMPNMEEPDILPEDIPLNILYEDADVIVINKPRGMVVHPAPGHYTGTLVNALLFHCQDLSGINGIMRPGIVHRIDKDTSGVMVAAKNDRAHQSLAAQLKAKTTERVYQAIVHGVPMHDKMTIDAPIGRDEKDRKKMAVNLKNGKNAVTHVQIEERFSHYSLASCRLETGRTHQIRVHMAYINHPIAGDPKYGPKSTLAIDGQALHARELGFVHPSTGEDMHFSAPLPEDMTQLLTELRNNG